MMSANKRVRVCAVMEGVLADADLVGVILAGNVGPSAFAAASCVCKTWATVCKTDERVVRGAALYTGGLTKSALMKLFAISSQEADALPRSTHKRFGEGRTTSTRSTQSTLSLPTRGWRSGEEGYSIVAGGRASRRGQRSRSASGAPFSRKNGCTHRRRV